ncbi:MAG: Uma2 family endonuclease [Acidimicrobiia bacterium]
MRTVFAGSPPAEIESWLEQRRALGQDLFDEVWEGDYHVVPGPHGRHGRIDHQLILIIGPRADAVGLFGSGPLNIGDPDNYRVPDAAYLSEPGPQLYSPSAAIVVEVVSPGDESRRKLGFYYSVGVEEVLIVDPDARTVEWFARGVDGFVPADDSQLLGLSAGDLTEALSWPD